MENTIKLQNIILIESSFKRNKYIDTEKEQLENEITIDLADGIDKNNNNLQVEVTLYFSIKSEKESIIDATIKMLGIFEYNDIKGLSLDNFKQINAPAIIFPFIREHLSSVSMKAGIKPILLAPVNFVQLKEEKDKKIN